MSRYASIILIVTIGALLALGLVTLFSAEQVSLSHANFEGHLGWAAIGIVGCYILTMIDYRRWQIWAWPFFWVAAFLLLLCFAPGIGQESNGATRWIKVGYRFQPSELAKLAGVLFLAAWYAKHADRAGTTWFGFFLPGLSVSILVALIAAEVDIGAATLLGAVTGIIMLMAGVRFRWLILGVVGAFSAIASGIYLLPERTSRFMAFLNPELHAKGDFWQQGKGLEAFGVGGWDGVGLGNVIQYVKRLPYMESDFIFPVIGGEFGLQVSLLVVLAYVTILIAGIIISLNAPDRFGTLLGSGLVGMIVIQAIIHMAVTTAVMPNTGLPLPFVSQGGTNLIVCFACIGLLLSIHRQAWSEPQFVAPQLKANLRITPRL
ncbi:MAG: cell division protein FtsW [Verrucomicrobiales bacterium]